MAAVRSGLFVAWVRAWRAGLVSADDAIERITRHDEPHLVRGLPGTTGDEPLARALLEFAAEPTLVLPAPGDPRGLPGPGDFTDAALAAGEGVLAGAESSLGLVPLVTRHGSAVGSATHSVTWQAFAVGSPSPDPFGVAEAEHSLTDAVRQAATELATLDVASWRPEVAAELAAIRRPAAGPGLPRCYDQRAQQLLATADRLDAVLALARQEEPGGAVNGHEARGRAVALRQLETAVRRAKLAAYNAPLP